MRISRPALLLFLCSLIPVSLSGQQSASTTSTSQQGAQGASILQQSLAAMTGGATISDVTLTGTVTVNNGSASESGAITLVATAAGQAQSTLALPSGTRLNTENYAANPRASSLTGPNGTTQTPPEDLMGPHPAWFCPALLIGAIAPQTYVASYVGPLTLNGSAVQHVSFWPQASNAQTSSFVTAGQQVLTGPGPSLPLQTGQEELFVDSSSMLPQELIIRMQGYRSDSNSTDPSHFTIPVLVDEHIQFSEYRQVQGRMVAFHIQVSFGPIPLMDIQLSSVSINTGATIAAN
jgi:hypothetical protein